MASPLFSAVRSVNACVSHPINCFITRVQLVDPEVVMKPRQPPALILGDDAARDPARVCGRVITSAWLSVLSASSILDSRIATMNDYPEESCDNFRLWPDGSCCVTVSFRSPSRYPRGYASAHFRCRPVEATQDQDIIA